MNADEPIIVPSEKPQFSYTIHPGIRPVDEIRGQSVVQSAYRQWWFEKTVKELLEKARY